MDASGGWRSKAACLDEPLNLFFRVHVVTRNGKRIAEEPDPAAQAICDRCPVATECLEEARAGDEDGTWGGTSHWQRQQLKRRYRRAMCPVCRVIGPLVEMGEAQACVACAQSWRATPVRSAP